MEGKRQQDGQPEKFVWLKKIKKDIERGLTTEELERQEAARSERNKREIEKLERQRLEREAEKEQRQRLKVYLIFTTNPLLMFLCDRNRFSLTGKR